MIIAGCGRVGAQLALHLAPEGHDVVVIDKDTASFSRLGVTFNGITLTGMTFDEELLKEAGAEKADALAAVTNFDNTNLMAAEVATKIFNIPMVVARLYNPDKRHTYNELGIEHICGTTLVAEHIKEKLLQGYLAVCRERMDLGIQIAEFIANDDAYGAKSIEEGGDFAGYSNWGIGIWAPLDEPEAIRTGIYAGKEFAGPCAGHRRGKAVEE